MEFIELLRAKSIDDGTENLLLKDHIIQSLKRLEELYKFTKLHEDFITYEYIKDKRFFIALAIALIFHDFGKINYNFQKRVYKKNDDLWKEVKDLLKPLSQLPDIRHEILSAIWASVLLDDDKNNDWKDFFGKIRLAILLHHYNEYYTREKNLVSIIYRELESIETYLQFIYNNKHKFEEFFKKLLEIVEKEFKGFEIIEESVKIIKDSINFERFKDLLIKIKTKDDDICKFAYFYEIDNEKINYDFFVFLGCLRRCDYTSSAGIDLESIDKEINNIEYIFKDLEYNIEKRINKQPKWQKELINQIDNGKSIILVAPTGFGKTEFALLWAKQNKKKLIYTLPLRVALNDLYIRFKEYFDHNYVGLLHSTSFLEYIQEKVENISDIDIDKKLSISKTLSYPILLSTPDQIFLTCLKYYGFDKVLSIYPFSSIVIDEIQAYTAEMVAIIIKTLEIIKKLGGQILIITATLPPYFNKFFNELGFEIREVREKLISKEDRELYNKKKHKVEIVEDFLVNSINSEYKVNKKILKYYIDKYKNKNIFIVVNNVKKAIKIFEYLTRTYKNSRDIKLLHSRLIEKQKNNTINSIRQILKNKNNKKPLIVVSTQIIEASVDFDFDVMLTEISPIDSQIQRWGRVNRRGRLDVNETNIIVFLGKNENQEKTIIDRGTKAIYPENIIEKTIEVLKNNRNKIEEGLSYEDEKQLIKKVFDDDTIKKYEENIRKKLDSLDYFYVEKKSLAQLLFRRLIGFQIVIPKIINKYGNKLEKEFSKIIEDKSYRNCSWKEIIETLKKKNVINERRKDIIWELKRILYSYSVNIPIFYFEKIQFKISHRFKGFYVLQIPDNNIDDLYYYGFDKIFKDLEEEEIKIKEKEEALENLYEIL